MCVGDDVVTCVCACAATSGWFFNSKNMVSIHLELAFCPPGGSKLGFLNPKRGC